MDNRGTLECLGCPFFAIPDIGYDIFVEFRFVTDKKDTSLVCDQRTH